MFSVDALPARMQAKIRVDEVSGCWRWTGAIKGRGYGSIRFQGVQYYVHRLSWELLVGPIPPGLVIDHLCRTPVCCNPGHLDPVTQLVNVRRGLHENVHKMCCKRGHPLFGYNLVIRLGRTGRPERNCRECNVQRTRECRERKRRHD